MNDFNAKRSRIKGRRMTQIARFCEISMVKNKNKDAAYVLGFMNGRHWIIRKFVYVCYVWEYEMRKERRQFICLTFIVWTATTTTKSIGGWQNEVKITCMRCYVPVLSVCLCNLLLYRPEIVCRNQNEHTHPKINWKWITQLKW